MKRAIGVCAALVLAALVYNPSRASADAVVGHAHETTCARNIAPGPGPGNATEDCDPATTGDGLAVTLRTENDNPNTIYHSGRLVRSGTDATYPFCVAFTSEDVNSGNTTLFALFRPSDGFSYSHWVMENDVGSGTFTSNMTLGYTNGDGTPYTGALGRDVLYWFGIASAPTRDASYCRTDDPGPPPDAESVVPPPHYDCAATVRTAASATTIVDLLAIGPTDDVNEWTVDDSPQVTNPWTGEWTEEVIPHTVSEQQNGSLTTYTYEATSILPDLGTMPPGGWWARFTAKRSLAGTELGAPPGSDWDRVEVTEGPDGTALSASEWWYVRQFGLLSTWVQGEVEKLKQYRGLTDEAARLWASGGWRLQDDTGADVEELATSATGMCAVLVDPTRTYPGPPSRGTDGTDGTTGLPGQDGEDGQDGDDDGEDDATDCDLSFGWGILNPLNIAKHIACQIARLFIPDDLSGWEDFKDALDGTFPFSLFADVAEVGDALGDAAAAGEAAGGTCGPALDLRFAVQNMPGADATTDDDAWEFNLPTPSTSSCEAMVATATRSDFDNSVGDLWGYRELVRAIGYLGLVVLVFHRFMRAARDRDDLELDL